MIQTHKLGRLHCRGQIAQQRIIDLWWLISIVSLFFLPILTKTKSSESFLRKKTNWCKFLFSFRRRRVVLSLSMLFEPHRMKEMDCNYCLMSSTCSLLVALWITAFYVLFYAEKEIRKQFPMNSTTALVYLWTVMLSLYSTVSIRRIYGGRFKTRRCMFLRLASSLFSARTGARGCPPVLVRPSNPHW